MLILIVAFILLIIGGVLVAKSKKSDPSSQQVGPAWTYNPNCRKPEGEIEKDGYKQTCFTKTQMDNLTEAEKKGECGKMNPCQ